jgi:dynein heavy chain, axonemal
MHVCWPQIAPLLIDKGACQPTLADLMRICALQAFDDCPTLSSAFKLLESFEGLLERDSIAAQLSRKHEDMVAAAAADVNEVQKIFQAHAERPVLSKNSPPHSGVLSYLCENDGIAACTCKFSMDCTASDMAQNPALPQPGNNFEVCMPLSWRALAGAVSWVRGLAERLAEPMSKLAALDRSVHQLPAYRALQHAHASLTAELRAYEDRLVADWTNQVAATSDEKLAQPLLRHAPNSCAERLLLEVNFDPALVRLLRETRYFLLLRIEVSVAREDCGKLIRTCRVGIL